MPTEVYLFVSAQRVFRVLLLAGWLGIFERENEKIFEGTQRRRQAFLVVRVLVREKKTTGVENFA